MYLVVQEQANNQFILSLFFMPPQDQRKWCGGKDVRTQAETKHFFLQIVKIKFICNHLFICLKCYAYSVFGQEQIKSIYIVS